MLLSGTHGWAGAAEGKAAFLGLRVAPSCAVAVAMASLTSQLPEVQQSIIHGLPRYLLRTAYTPLLPMLGRSQKALMGELK